MKLFEEDKDAVLAQLLAQQSSFDLKRISLEVLRYWYWVAGCAVLGAGIAFAINRWTTPVYEVSYKFLKQEQQDKMLLPQGMGMDMALSGLNLEYENAFFFSSENLLAVVRDLQLQVAYFSGSAWDLRQVDQAPALLQYDSASAQLPWGVRFEVLPREQGYTLQTEDAQWAPLLQDKVFAWGKTAEVQGFRFALHLQPGKPMEPFSWQLNDPELVAKGLGASCAVRPVGEKSSSSKMLLQFGLYTPLPEQGKLVLRQLLQRGQERNIVEKNEQATRTVEFIESQLAAISDSMQQTAGRMHALKLQNKELAAGSLEVFKKVNQLEEEKQQLRMLNKYCEYLGKYIKGRSQAEIITPSTFGVESKILDGLIEKYITLRLEERALVQEQINVPLYKAERESKRRMLASLEESMLGSIQNIVSANQFRIRELEGKNAVLMGSVEGLLGEEKVFADYQRLYELNEKLFVMLLERKAEASITKAAGISDYRPIDRPEVFAQAVKPNKLQNYLIGLVLGLALPIGVLALRALLDRKLHVREDLESESGMSVLAEIPLVKVEESVIAVQEKPKSRLAEAFRGMRVNMRYLLGTETTGQVLLFTSSRSGEGKTFCAANLAASLAQAGKQVLLIGGDLRKPRLQAYFPEVPAGRGLSAYLAGFHTLDEVLKPSRTPGMDVLSAGAVPPNPAELLSSERMGELLLLLRARYDYILIDSAPVGLVWDAKELFAHADLVVLVARANFTERQAMRQMKEILGAVALKKSVLLFNAVDMQSSRYGYGRYGDGYYEEEYRKGMARRLADTLK